MNEKNNILNRIKEIKSKFKLECVGTIGNFTGNLLRILFSSQGLFVTENDQNECRLWLIDSEDGKVKKQIKFKENICAFAYVPEGDFLIFNQEGSTLLRMDLKTEKITPFDRENNLANSNSTLKIFKQKVFHLDPYNHVIKIFDFDGNIIQLISFKNRFEFPIQFCCIPETDQIVLTGFDESFKLKYSQEYDKYKCSSFDPETNIAVYHLNNDELKYLPKINSEGRYLFYISTDHQNNIFINNDTNLYKLDSKFNLIFKVDIFSLNPENPIDKSAQFFPSCTDGEYLYFLERNKYKTIYKIKI